MSFLQGVTRLQVQAGVFKTVFEIHRGLTFTVRGCFRRGNFFCFGAPVVAASSARKTKGLFRMAANSGRSFFNIPTGLAMSKRLRNRLKTLKLKTVCAFKPAFETRGSGACQRLTRF